MTARWVVDEVAPVKDLRIEWEPISLLFKNRPDSGSARYQPSVRTHGLLRVMESVRTEQGNDGVFRAYWGFGTRIHHDGQLFDFDIGEVLSGAGIDPSHAGAFGNDRWDDEIRRRMDAGLDLVGQEVGTPIISMGDGHGGQVGIFGPVITRVPTRDASLRLWEMVVVATLTPGFWELKRTRTEDAQFGDRPDGVPLPSEYSYG